MSSTEQGAEIDAWDDVLDKASYYEILSVERLADPDAVRVAFHRFALAFHPDAHGDAGDAQLAKLRRIFQAGAEACRVLTDPELRLRYDVGLARGQLRMDPEALRRQRLSSSEHKALHELCRSGAAKLCALRADKLLSAGDLRGAKKAIEAALAHDGGINPGLRERLDAIDVALYAMGG